MDRIKIIKYFLRNFVSIRQESPGVAYFNRTRHLYNFTKRGPASGLLYIIMFFNLLICSCTVFQEGRAISEKFEGGKLIPDSAIRIYIRPLSGVPSDPFFNAELVRSLKSDINLDGRLAVVEDEKAADLSLGLVLVSYGEQDVRFDATGRVTVRRISLTLAVTVTDIAGGGGRVKAKETDSSVLYNTDGSIMSDVYRELADRTSANVLSIILTGWDLNRPGQKRHDL